MALSVKGRFPDLNKATSELRRILPLKIANLAKNHFLDGFKKDGKQTDASSSGWAQRKKLDKANRGRRAILVKSGALRNDIDIRRTNLNEIVLGTLDTNYASFHNDGTDKMSQREFLGNSKKLDRKIISLSDREFKRIFDK